MRPLALVTGCSTGIGRALVPALLAKGWDVAATLRDSQTRAGEFAAERAAHGDALHLLELDVTRADQRAEIAAWVKDRGSGLDALVNNAGYGLCGALEDLDEGELRAQLDVNFFAAAAVTKALLPELRRVRGRIVNVSSTSGFSAVPLNAAYNASKFALEGLSEALRFELAPQGVQVALVQPGGFRTRFGSNLRWGAACDAPTSAYREQTAGLRAFQQRRREGKGTPPDPVVRAVVSLLARRKMPLRTRVGTDAHFLWTLRSVLPAGLWLAAMTAMFRRLLGVRQ